MKKLAPVPLSSCRWENFIILYDEVVFPAPLNQHHTKNISVLLRDQKKAEHCSAVTKIQK